MRIDNLVYRKNTRKKNHKYIKLPISNTITIILQLLNAFVFKRENHFLKSYCQARYLIFIDSPRYLFSLLTDACHLWWYSIELSKIYAIKIKYLNRQFRKTCHFVYLPSELKQEEFARFRCRFLFPSQFLLCLIIYLINIY